MVHNLNKDILEVVPRQNVGLFSDFELLQVFGVRLWVVCAGGETDFRWVPPGEKEHAFRETHGRFRRCAGMKRLRLAENP